VKYKIRDGKDFIMDGKIFKPVDGVVELPRKVDHPDLTPVVAPKKAPAKGKAKNDNA